MRRWFHGERDWETPEAEVDLRLGGDVRVVMRDPDKDAEYGGGGPYTEIDPPTRLAFTWTWDDDDTRTLIELDFEEADGVTTVRFTHSGLRDEDSVRSHEGGWTTAFDNLERALETRRRADRAAGRARPGALASARHGHRDDVRRRHGVPGAAAAAAGAAPGPAAADARTPTRSSRPRSRRGCRSPSGRSRRCGGAWTSPTCSIVGTGNGLDALGAAEIFDLRTLAVTDLHEAAVAVARENVLTHLEDPGALRLTFHAGDLLACVPAAERFSLVYENLPNLPAAPAARPAARHARRPLLRCGRRRRPGAVRRLPPRPAPPLPARRAPAPARRRRRAHGDRRAHAARASPSTSTALRLPPAPRRVRRQAPGRGRPRRPALPRRGGRARAAVHVLRARGDRARRRARDGGLDGRALADAVAPDLARLAMSAGEAADRVAARSVRRPLGADGLRRTRRERVAMAGDVVVATVEPRLTAVVAETTTWEAFPTLWAPLLDEVYAVVRPRPELVARPRSRAEVAERDALQGRRAGRRGRRARRARFEAVGRVVPSQLPAGRVAMAVHRGDYAGLGRAHDAVHRFAADRGLELAGPRWEIYGHWSADPGMSRPRSTGCCADPRARCSRPPAGATRRTFATQVVANVRALRARPSVVTVSRGPGRRTQAARWSPAARR